MIMELMVKMTTIQLIHLGWLERGKGNDEKMNKYSPKALLGIVVSFNIN